MILKEIQTSALLVGGEQNYAFKSLVVNSYNDAAFYYECKISDSSNLNSDFTSLKSALVNITCKFIDL